MAQQRVPGYPIPSLPLKFLPIYSVLSFQQQVQGDLLEISGAFSYYFFGGGESIRRYMYALFLLIAYTKCSILYKLFCSWLFHLTM